MNIEVSAIIVSYNTREMTLRCLRALATALDGVASEIFVVDNNSTDGTSESIRNGFPSVILIENSRNAGFGAANNIAMRVASGRYFLLINSDAFAEEAAIATLLAFMRDHPEAGVVGPSLIYEDGRHQVSCHKFPSPIYAWLENFWLSSGYRRWGHDAVRRVDFVIGACMLVRREAFEQTGGFDEQFFMYCEESDWQREIWGNGWEVVFVPTVPIIHLAGASGSDKPAVNESFFESLDRYVRKHHGTTGLISFRLAMVAGCAMRAAAWGGLSLLPRSRAHTSTRMLRHLLLTWRQATHWPALKTDPEKARAVST